MNFYTVALVGLGRRDLDPLPSAEREARHAGQSLLDVVEVVPLASALLLWTATVATFGAAFFSHRWA